VEIAWYNGFNPLRVIANVASILTIDNLYVTDEFAPKTLSLQVTFEYTD